MFPSSASPLELLWTSVAVFGAGIATALLAYVWLSYRAVIAWIRRGWAVRWGPRHKFTLGFLIGIALLLLVWIGFAALGANALVNPPAADTARQEASERGGWIIIVSETALLIVTGLLLWAWVAVGRPTLRPNTEPMTMAELFMRATGAGREIGHLVSNETAVPVGNIDIVLATAVLTDLQRELLTEARDRLVDLAERVRVKHDAIKQMEPKS